MCEFGHLHGTWQQDTGRLHTSVQIIRGFSLADGTDCVQCCYMFMGSTMVARIQIRLPCQVFGSGGHGRLCGTVRLSKGTEQASRYPGGPLCAKSQVSVIGFGYWIDS